jgi:hypothetical protein
MFKGPNATSSKSVGIKSCSSGFWSTDAMDARIFFAFFEVALIPSTAMSPRPLMKTLIASSRVDLPAPFGPISATLSPWGMVRSIFDRALVPSG